MQDRLSQILNFLETIDSFKSIERATYLSDQNRHESDTDHTWHMAMFALLLHEELNLKVDLTKVLKLILIHDLCEIYAGDTFAYSPQHKNHKKEKEAAEKIFAFLPQDLERTLLDAWMEFTFGTSPEACFARSLDRMQALAQNVISSGRTWKERGVKETMSRELNQDHVALDPVLKTIFEMYFQRASEENLWSS
jgi:putative hydrolase of HD superfamily